MQEGKPPLLCVWESKKERRKGEASVIFLVFIPPYYEKELGTIATNKQTWHLALLHL